MAEESSRGKPGLAEVLVVHARGALKQTSLRANDFQLVKEDSPDFAFTVNQNSYHLSSDNGVVTLTVDGVDFSNVLIDLGATWTLMGQQTWNW